MNIKRYIESSNLLCSNLRRGASHGQTDKEKEMEVRGGHPDQELLPAEPEDSEPLTIAREEAEASGTRV